MPHWQNLFTALREQDIRVSAGDLPRPVGGGSNSSAWRVRIGDHSVFLKTGPASSLDVFLAEADGLRELGKSGAISVPTVLACVCSGKDSALALEWIDFEPATKNSERMLGRNLARLHRNYAKQFGWRRDNTIGRTPQHNPWNDDWVAFFKENRLAFQLQLAARNGFHGKLQTMGTRLLDNIGHFFSGYWPDASLLHGDLWGGNWAACAGEPVIFDPAVYYGDRETDIAMTRLFGGFGAAFYEAYEEAWPLADGHSERERLYQLYHVLNHLNLFGAAYLGRAECILRELT
jgi:fructosamine-3-kinase